jgi:hypothetical protein
MDAQEEQKFDRLIEGSYSYGENRGISFAIAALAVAVKDVAQAIRDAALLPKDTGDTN